MATPLFVDMLLRHPADTWPAFRGSGDSISMAHHLPLAWTKDSGVDWTVQLTGTGQSSPIIWRDRISATVDGPRKERAIVACFDVSSGRKLWETEIKSAEPHRSATTRAAPPHSGRRRRTDLCVLRNRKPGGPEPRR